MNKELKEALEKIEFSKKEYNLQNPHIIFPGEDCLIIEGGGGGTTKRYLDHIVNHGGRLITLDMCTKPGDKIYMKEEHVGSGGKGDYSEKRKLYKMLIEDKVISKCFEWHDGDIYTFFKNRPKLEIDYYFDDATHESKYLLPLFELIIPMCKIGAIIGTHDTRDTQMKEFVDFLRKHEKLKIVQDRNNSLFCKVIKK